VAVQILNIYYKRSISENCPACHPANGTRKIQSFNCFLEIHLSRGWSLHSLQRRRNQERYQEAGSSYDGYEFFKVHKVLVAHPPLRRVICRDFIAANKKPGFNSKPGVPKRAKQETGAGKLLSARMIANMSMYITGGEARPGGPQVFLPVEARLRKAVEHTERPGRVRSLKICSSDLRISVVTNNVS
jgi:hypothetical protein